MSYQSLKRVLGETHLERKCRFLFGACLLLLIFGSFMWYGTETTKLVKESGRKAGRDFVDSSLIKYHFAMWETDPTRHGMLHELIRNLQSQEYDWKVLALTPPQTTADLINDKWKKPVILPRDQWEREALDELKREYKKQIEAGGLDPKSPAPPPSASEAESERPLAAPSSIEPVFRDRWVRSKREYHYYQPVYWKAGCTTAGCHYSKRDIGALSAADAADAFPNEGPPFRVIKVIIPDEETQKAISWNWGVLLTTAIVTVFLAMVALYVIVRYVIVKPLKHLRYVSDEISRGNTSVRANIQTRDEFEDLADSFNRMLRRLIGTQQELQAVNHDLDGKVDDLAQANMQLYEMNRLKSDFLATMSHELRTPLNSIIGFSDVLQGLPSLEDKQKRYVANIQKSGRVLLEMINDILDLAKMESGKMELRPTEFRIDALLSAQCDMVRSLTEEKNIDLSCDTEADLPPLYQDQGKLQQILTNLLSNAIKFTPEGGRIELSAHRDDRGRLVLWVADTGVGIAPDDLEVIFEKFRQGSIAASGDNLTREYSGTGLGLSIVRELCRLMGGDVAVESEVGKGSTFTVRVPWTAADQAERAADIERRLDELSHPQLPELAGVGSEENRS